MDSDGNSPHGGYPIGDPVGLAEKKSYRHGWWLGGTPYHLWKWWFLIHVLWYLNDSYGMNGLLMIIFTHISEESDEHSVAADHIYIFYFCWWLIRNIQKPLFLRKKNETYVVDHDHIIFYDENGTESYFWNLISTGCKLMIIFLLLMGCDGAGKFVAAPGHLGGVMYLQVDDHWCWLVVWTPLKNISQLGWLLPIYGKIKNVPNHQPGW